MWECHLGKVRMQWEGVTSGGFRHSERKDHGGTGRLMAWKARGEMGAGCKADRESSRTTQMGCLSQLNPGMNLVLGWEKESVTYVARARIETWAKRI